MMKTTISLTGDTLGIISVAIFGIYIVPDISQNVSII